MCAVHMLPGLLQTTSPAGQDASACPCRQLSFKAATRGPCPAHMRYTAYLIGDTAYRPLSSRSIGSCRLRLSRQELMLGCSCIGSSPSAASLPHTLQPQLHWQRLLLLLLLLLLLASACMLYSGMLPMQSACFCVAPMHSACCGGCSCCLLCCACCCCTTCGRDRAGAGPAASACCLVPFIWSAMTSPCVSAFASCCSISALKVVAGRRRAHRRAAILVVVCRGVVYLFAVPSFPCVTVSVCES